ncbi:MAG TPA: OmpA family protein [Blastocatellia bacterium]|nr:OmpA family protein [Blastocatellia bacterium]
MKRSPAISVSALLALLALGSLAFAQAGADVRRRTIAITYLRDPVKVTLAGTTLRPTAKGEATVERWRKRNESEIDITIENMIPAFNYGADFTTYVLWAITPAGQVDNLGEFRLSGDTARLRAATPQQTFAMLITAEPHYLVKLPSRMVVLENLAPTSKNVQVQASEIYFTGDSGRYYTDTSVPGLAERDYNKTPMELLQARRAIQIARLADGERHDPTDFNEAVNLLNQAEAAFRRGAKVHDVGLIARQSITMAVRTRDISEERALAAERRVEISRRDAEVRRATETASDLSSQLSDTDSRLKASEIARLNAQDQLDRVMREAADARAENRSLRSENDKLSRQVDRLNQDLTDARGRIADLQSQYSSTTARLTETSSRVEAMERAEREKQQAEARRRDFATLRSGVAALATIKPSGNGFIATLPDAFFVPNQTALQLRVKAKMDALANLIAANRDAVFTIEGHADARPNADDFALGRAQSVADYLGALGVPRSNFKVESRGATIPISTRKTVAARATNRRVELVFVGPQ